MKYRILFFVVLLLTSLFLVSCDKKHTDITTVNTDITSSSATEAGSDLTFRITWKDYSGRGEAIQKIVDSYNNDYSDGVTVSMVNGNEDRTEIENLLTGSSETIYVLPYRYVKYFSEKGYLMDLTSSFEAEEELFYPEIWDLGTVDDKAYGIPWLGHSMCLLYNKDLLNTAGVDPDSINSLDALLSAIELVEEKTDAQGIGLIGADSNDVSWMVNQFIYGFGSSLVSADGKTVTINNDESKSALDFYKNVLGEHAQSTWVDDTGVEVMSNFRNQSIAFEIQGIWGVTDIMKNGAPFEVGIIPMKDIGLNAEVGPMMLAIPENMSDEMKQEAIRFIRYMISTEAQEKIMNGEYSPEHDTYYPFRTPIRIDMVDSRIFQSYPDYMFFVEGFSNPSIDVPVPAWQIVKDEFYQPGLHQVMSGEISIDDFLERIETEGNAILVSK